MNASRENCLKALEMLQDQEPLIQQETADFLKSFLTSAAKRLPSEASIIKDKQRKQSKIK